MRLFLNQLSFESHIYPELAMERGEEVYVIAAQPYVLLGELHTRSPLCHVDRKCAITSFGKKIMIDGDAVNVTQLHVEDSLHID
ncbi:MAG: hypothetical protein SGPRY_012275 [Prymnesium sp.]